MILYGLWKARNIHDYPWLFARMKMMKEFGKMENMGGMMEGLGGIDPAQAVLVWES